MTTAAANAVTGHHRTNFKYDTDVIADLSIVIILRSERSRSKEEMDHRLPNCGVIMICWSYTEAGVQVLYWILARNAEQLAATSLQRSQRSMPDDSALRYAVYVQHCTHTTMQHDAVDN